jgi:two-component system chemotaxis response regulator CheB
MQADSFNRDILVIGGSAGATGPLKAILGSLPVDLPAAVFIVIHIPARSLGILATVTAAATLLPVHAAVDGMAIERGHVYLAVPDHHMILSHGQIRLGRGPRENMSRPAIDPLFRSAAVAYGPRVVGVLLSGLLNDGTAGLEAVQRCGGFTVVQDPDDAIADEMPRSAASAITVDLSVPSTRLGDVLWDVVNQPAGPGAPVPPELRIEIDIAAGERVDSGIMRKIATPVALTCPDCGGVMSMVDGSKPLRFRCQVGHAHTAEGLASLQEGAIDEALRVALRIVEERAELVQRMAKDSRKSGYAALAQMYEDRAIEYRTQSDTIRRAVLQSLPDYYHSAADEGGADI